MIRIPRDRKFERGKKDSRMPIRDVHGDERMDAGKREQDFNLRRPRDAPVPGRENRYRQSGTTDRQQRADFHTADDYRSRREETVLGENTEERYSGNDFRSDHDVQQFTQRENPERYSSSGMTDQESPEHEQLSRDGRSRSFLDPERTHTEPEKTVQFGKNGKSRRLDQHGNQYQKRFQEAAQAEDAKESSSGAVSEEPRRNSKLAFTAGEVIGAGGGREM